MSKSNITLLNYNNYYNRQVLKAGELVSDYAAYIVYSVGAVNFYPADGVNTSLVLNIDATACGNYLLVSNEYGQILSRWFIIEARNVRNAQVDLTLRRDVMADFFDEITNAPCFIEKAFISNLEDTSIYNKENVNYNQIKRAEAILKDRSLTPWIVGYLVNTSDEGTRDEITVTIPIDTGYPNYDITDFIRTIENESGQGAKIATLPFEVTEVAYRVGCNFAANNYYYDFTKGGVSKTESGVYSSYIVEGGKENEFKSHMNSSISNAAYSAAESYAAKSYASNLSEWIDYNDKIVQYNNVVYKLHITPASPTQEIFDLAQGTAAYIHINNACGSAVSSGLIRRTSEPLKYQLKAVYNSYTLSYEIVEARSELTATIGTGVRQLDTEPYAMFCIPFDGQVAWSGFNEYTAKAEYAMRFAQAISVAAGSFIKDIQLLPYCPCLEQMIGYSFDFSGLTEGVDYTLLKDENADTFQWMIWCRNNTFSTTSSFNGFDLMRLVPSNPLDFKVVNETRFCRLISPNYSGAFDFRPTELSGPTDTIIVDIDCTYRPYNPYIHANPRFSKLYGDEFDDARGLICGGDFSITQISDAWTQYQINNKTYNQSFDRQIENLEVNQAAQRTNEKWNIGTGIATGIVSGATGGAMAGSVVPGAGTAIGAVAGGVIGGVASLAGGLADYQMNEKLRNEALDYTRDMYQFNLANIKAMPQTISKTGAMNYNTRLYITVEFYSATETEEEALRNKIKYDGMTVSRIGKIADFLQEEPTYIKGQLIRLELPNEDYHLAKEISNEIYKGGFM